MRRSLKEEEDRVCLCSKAASFFQNVTVLFRPLKRTQFCLLIDSQDNKGNT